MMRALGRPWGVVVGVFPRSEARRRGLPDPIDWGTLNISVVLRGERVPERTLRARYVSLPGVAFVYANQRQPRVL